MKEQDQIPLFENPPAWTEHWDDNLLGFRQGSEEPFDSIIVHFRNATDRRNFLQLVGERPERRRSIWYPPMSIVNQSVKNAPAVKVEPNRYPVYIISKGRWERRHTSRSLDRLGIAYRIVIEPQEYDHYAGVIDPKKITTLPFSNLGQGSIPARNWVWEDSIKRGVKRHWILDDNIDGFYRLNDNRKVKVIDFNPFTACEEFTDQYANVAISGLNYEFLINRRAEYPPYYLNTRIYSCILIRNDIPYRWRGRYNEDTDLCIRVLKDGYCTVLFNAVLAKKLPTMTQKGGNTDELYKGDGRLKMAESLRDQHPDIVKVTRKWGRWQHHVDYSVFKKNKLIPILRKPMAESGG